MGAADAQYRSTASATAEIGIERNKARGQEDDLCGLFGTINGHNRVVTSGDEPRRWRLRATSWPQEWTCWPALVAIRHELQLEWREMREIG